MPRVVSALPVLPSCLLCLCISTSVYCDDADLEHIPPLPPETTYLYARFNRIGAIRASDFTGLSMSGQGSAMGHGGNKRFLVGPCSFPPSSPSREAEANRPDKQFHLLGRCGCLPLAPQSAGAHPAREQADGAA